MPEPSVAPRIAYVSYATEAASPLTVAGKLCLPMGAPTPQSGAAVVICHGSDGVDGRGDFYVPALLAEGIATLEIDMWAARGSARGAGARPSSPIETLPDAFGALRFLGRQPEIDPTRIGVMGFSWGGAVTLLTAVRKHAEALSGGAPPFAAHAANYPVCWVYGRLPGLSLGDRTAAPILIQTGDADGYDAPDAGEVLVASLGGGGAGVTCMVHRGAAHGFDRDRPAQTIVDPFAHQGAGGPVLLAFNPAAAFSARDAIIRFFQQTLDPR
jgi:uncharacterized protein